jgi:hypothetical protein
MERLGPVMSRNDAAVQTLWKSERRGGRPEPGEAIEPQAAVAAGEQRRPQKTIDHAPMNPQETPGRIRYW